MNSKYISISAIVLIFAFSGLFPVRAQYCPVPTEERATILSTESYENLELSIRDGYDGSMHGARIKVKGDGIDFIINLPEVESMAPRVTLNIGEETDLFGIGRSTVSSMFISDDQMDISAMPDEQRMAWE